MAGIESLTIAAAGAELASGTVTAVDLAEAGLARIAARQDEVGAYLHVDAEGALKAAESSDARRKSGKARGPLDGIPVGLKDVILVEGLPATAASRILEGYVASYDATVTTRLRDAGAVILGKTNLDEFAMGASTENSALGTTRNPHDLTRVPGGSSGGSAAAVADFQAFAALGTDTGGSIRQPAAFCGVVGFKPTYGAVPRTGSIALASSFDQIGPLARTVRDAATVFSAIAGRDPLDATSSPRDCGADGLPDATPGDAAGLRIGIPSKWLTEGLSPEVAEGFAMARERFRELGHEIVDVTLPDPNLALSCYYILQPAEASSNLARYDGIRYARLPGADGTLLERYLENRGKGFGAEAKRRITLGTFVLSSGYYDAYYGKAQGVRTLITEGFAKAFEGVDVLLTPVTPTTAFRFGEKSDPVQMYLADIFTIAVNLAGLPAVSVPVSPPGSAYGPDAMPVGFQLIGPRFADGRVLRLGMRYEEA